MIWVSFLLLKPVFEAGLDRIGDGLQSRNRLIVTRPQGISRWRDRKRSMAVRVRRGPWVELGAMVFIVTLSGCGGDEPSHSPPQQPQERVDDFVTQLPPYVFESRFGEGSGVSYAEATARHLLILELDLLIAELDASGRPASGAIVDRLMQVVDLPSTEGAASRPIRTGVDGTMAAQQTFGELGEAVSVLDAMPDRAASFRESSGRAMPVVGYKDDSLSPTDVLLDLFAEIENLVLTRGEGTPGPGGEAIERVYVSASGIDYRQLVSSYLTTAVAYSQAADALLDDDVAGEGLLSSPVEPEAFARATRLENAWDQAFGYFGAARDYDAYTDDEIAAAGGRDAWQGSHDSDGDSRIDFTAEYNFGDARLAAERDRSSASAIDLTRDAFGALLLGRTMVASATQGLSLEELDTLRGYRDRVLAAWEKTIAASAIHAINDVLEDVASFDNERYDFEAHARHWSALKGLVLGLQFNPRHAIVRPEQRLGLDAAVGAAPVLADADRATRAAHQEELRAARSTLFEIYGFDPVDLGDDNGAGGW